MKPAACLLAVAACLAAAGMLTLAQAAAPAAAASAAAPKGKAGDWASLTPAQQQVLAPLARDWPQIEANRRQKWLELAAKFSTLPVDERQRVQARMAEWARMTPAERTQARMQFQAVQQLPAEERNAKWQAYQALPVEERKTLAARGQPSASGAGVATAGGRPAPARPSASGVAGNRAIAPIVVQVGPGATTKTMTARSAMTKPTPPGEPKIAATAGNVDPATLLPKRGPQVAASSPRAENSETN